MGASTCPSKPKHGRAEALDSQPIASAEVTIPIHCALAVTAPRQAACYKFCVFWGLT
jgi:hypothetical protein